MSKNIIFKKPRKLEKKAREISIQGEEIKTRMSKSTVRKRIDDWNAYGVGEQMGDYDYFDFINWGAEGGRPRIWKIKTGGALSSKQVKWLEAKRVKL